MGADDDPAEAERGNVLPDACTAVSLATALVDAATLDVVEQGGDR